MSLLPFKKQEESLGKMHAFSKSNAVRINLYEEITAIRAALLWFSQHPQFMPLFKTFSKFAVNHVLTSCLSNGGCHRCKQCLRLLGLNIGDGVGTVEICEALLMSAYTEAIHDPVYSLQMAQRGVDFISHAIENLAAMPERAEQYHSLLAKYLLTIRDDLLPPGSTEDHDKRVVEPSLLQTIMAEGDKIYLKGTGQRFSSWLYVGIPEILGKIQAQGIRDERALATVINDVYKKWQAWAHQHSASRPASLVGRNATG